MTCLESSWIYSTKLIKSWTDWEMTSASSCGDRVGVAVGINGIDRGREDLIRKVKYLCPEDGCCPAEDGFCPADNF